jgi:hypothetical protein
MAGSFEHKDRAMKRQWREILHHLEMSDARFHHVCRLAREEYDEAVENRERRKARGLEKEQQLLSDIGRMRHGLKAAGWTAPTGETGERGLAAEAREDGPPFDYEAITRRLAG